MALEPDRRNDAGNAALAASVHPWEDAAIGKSADARLDGGR
jgi:hypothetical protein